MTMQPILDLVSFMMTNVSELHKMQPGFAIRSQTKILEDNKVTATSPLLKSLVLTNS